MSVWLLRGAIWGLRCSPYGCTAALLDPTSTRSRRQPLTPPVPLMDAHETA
jgi:hypothetical protein